MDSLFDFSLYEYINNDVVVIRFDKKKNPFQRTYELETEEVLRRQRYNGLQQLKKTLVQIKEKQNT